MYAIRSKTNRSNIPTHWNGTAWSNGVPTAVKDAHIDADFTTANGSFSCRDLVITSSAILTVATGSYIKILQNIQQSPTSKIVVKTKGSLMLLYKNASTGTVRFQIESTFSEKQRFDYEFLSFPVSGLTLKSISPGTSTSRFYTFNEPTDEYLAINPNTTLTQPGIGYMIRVAADFPLTPSNWTLSLNNFSANNINRGLITTPVSKLGNGFNMIGNPYTSQLDTRKFFIANTNVFKKGYFWKKTNGAQGSSYIVHNSFTGNMNYHFNQCDLFQALLLEKMFSSPPDVVIFTPEMMLPSNDYSTPDRLYINIKQVGFFYPIGGFCYDIKKFPIPFTDIIGNGAISVTNNGNKVICRKDTFDISDELSLRVLFEVSSNYIITIRDSYGLFENLENILLIDQQLGIIHNLRISDYLFSSDAGEFMNRFKIVFKPQ